MINFDSTRYAAHEIPPDKARREITPMIMKYR
jgi:hypothetical protein